eukprot:2901348-Pleurochrysis_carterae.AAC.2
MNTSTSPQADNVVTGMARSTTHAPLRAAPRSSLTLPQQFTPASTPHFTPVSTPHGTVHHGIHVSRELASSQDGLMLAHHLDSGPLVGPLEVMRSSGDGESNTKPIGVATHHATLLSSTVNMANTVLGVGLLALPRVFAHSGIVWGIIFNFVAVFTNIFTCHLIGECQARAGRPSSFKQLADAALPYFSLLVDAGVLANCLGAGCS